MTKWIKEDDELRSIPVIAVTAFAMKGDEERIRQGGCEAYMSKPISVGKFIETVKAYLGDGLIAGKPEHRIGGLVRRTSCPKQAPFGVLQSRHAAAVTKI